MKIHSKKSFLQVTQKYKLHNDNEDIINDGYITGLLSNFSIQVIVPMNETFVERIVPFSQEHIIGKLIATCWFSEEYDITASYLELIEVKPSKLYYIISHIAKSATSNEKYTIYINRYRSWPGAINNFLQQSMWCMIPHVKNNIKEIKIKHNANRRTAKSSGHRSK